MAGRATLWLLWRCLLAATVVLSTGCHLLFGSYEAEDTNKEDESLLGVCDKGTFRCKEEVLLACSADQRSSPTNAKMCSRASTTTCTTTARVSSAR